MSSILKDPTASEPDIIAPALKAQLRRLFLAKPNRVAQAGGGESLVEWQKWAFENKWGLILISSLGAFLYYRWKYCREENKPAIYATDFKQDPHYFTPTVSQPMGYGVPAMQSVSWRGNGAPMASSNQLGQPNQMFSPMASNQMFM